MKNQNETKSGQIICLLHLRFTPNNKVSSMYFLFDQAFARKFIIKTEFSLHPNSLEQSLTVLTNKFLYKLKQFKKSFLMHSYKIFDCFI